jgi:hypothetical protein
LEVSNDIYEAIIFSFQKKGWTHGSATFSTMVTSDASRAQFVINAVNYLKQYNFDGLGTSLIKIILRLTPYQLSKIF